MAMIRRMPRGIRVLFAMIPFYCLIFSSEALSFESRPWPTRPTDTDLSAIENWSEPLLPQDLESLPVLPSPRAAAKPPQKPIMKSFNGTYHFYGLAAGDNPPAGFNNQGVAFSLFEFSLPGMVSILRCFDPLRSRHFIAAQKCDGNLAIEGKVLGFAWLDRQEDSKPLLQCYDQNSDNLLTTVAESDCEAPGLRGTQAIGYL